MRSLQISEIASVATDKPGLRLRRDAQIAIRPGISNLIAGRFISFFCHTIWTLPQVVGTNPLPTYYQEPRASLTAWWCIIETKSSHVAKTSHWAKVSHWVKVSHWAKVSHWVKVSHWAKVSHWVKVSHWAKVSHWVKVSHWAQLSHWMLILGFLCWMGVGIAALVQLSSHVSIGCSCRMLFAVV